MARALLAHQTCSSGLLEEQQNLEFFFLMFGISDKVYSISAAQAIGAFFSKNRR